MSLGFDEKVQIQKQVVLGMIPPISESKEAEEYRKKIVIDFRKANAAGQMLSFPVDWD